MMKRILSILLVIAFCPMLANADPGRFHFLRDKWWWAGEIVNGVVVGLDYGSVQRAQSRGAVETNILLGSHPSAGATAGVGVAAFAFWTGLHALEYGTTKNEKNREWQDARLWAIPMIASGVHIDGAVSNLNFKAANIPPIH